VADGRRSFPLTDDFITNATRDEINAAFAEAGMANDQMTIFFNPIVIETGGKKVLVDTGYGPEAARQPQATIGLLSQSLGVAGIDPASIDLVVITHFHADHVNGLTTADGTLIYPNAEITVPEDELAFWMNDDEMARAPAGRMEELFHINRRVFTPLRDRLSKYSAGDEVVPGVTAVATPGHTVGHKSFLITSGSESLFVQSDVTNNPDLFVRHPGWHARFDQNPVQAEATRRKIYDMLAAERMPVQGFHYPFPSRGLVEKDKHGDGYRLIPIA
jgi:glyoxylase-like metal-dependent hydrolase (beta-lactamase superfamily II)